MQVFIDRAATPPRLSDETVAAWAAGERIFVSSVMDELAAERAGVADVIAEIGAEPVLFETLGGRDDDARQAYLTEVAASTIYLGILGRNYGRLLPTRLSATHEEYREAEQLGLRISVWVRNDSDRQGDQQAFVEEVRTFHTTGSFTGAHDLAKAVAQRLRRMAAEEISPWCKLGDAVFRAREITDDGKQVVIDAMIHDPQVVSYLEAQRPGWWSARESWLTYAATSGPVDIKEVVKTTTASRATAVRILAVPDRDREPSGWATSFTMSGRTYSDEDLTELALRKALFGEPAPRDVVAYGAKLSDPFSDLPAEPLSEDVLRPLVRLLLTETLVGRRRASRIAALHLSTPIGGRRRLILTWEGRAERGYRGEQRTIDGYLTTI